MISTRPANIKIKVGKMVKGKHVNASQGIITTDMQ
jgi:hypothetical protein